MTSNSSNKNPTASYTWFIDNFSSFSTNLHSPHFFTQINQHEFYLTLVPKNVAFCDYSWSKEQVFIYLWNPFNSSIVEGEEIFSNISILDSKGEKCHTQSGRSRCTNSGDLYGWKYNIARSYLMGKEKERFLPNDMLTIYCEKSIFIYSSVKVIEDNFAQSKKAAPLPQSSSSFSRKIVANYQSLLESGKFSDVALIIGGKEFKVHKAILSARSKVFAAMFEHDLEENKQNRVEIIDLDSQVGEILLQYIYCETVPVLDDYALELFVASDKYELDCLKSLCEQYLCSNLTIDSVAKVLLVAEMHQAVDLKTKCIDYIVKHSNEVQHTDGWKDLMTNRPKMGFQLFLNLASKM